MNEMEKKILGYYCLIERKNHRKAILLASAILSVSFSLLFIISGRTSEFVRRFSIGLCFFTLLFLFQCVHLEIKDKICKKAVIKFEDSRDVSDLQTNLLDIKKLHNSVVIALEKYNLQSFSDLEEARYKSMWKNYFLAWFMLENDKVYRFRANGKNEFDDFAITKNFNKLYVLHQQLLQEFSADSEFEQILNDHFLSLKKDYYNLSALR